MSDEGSRSALNTFNLATIHVNRCTRHPLRGRGDHESEEFGDLFWLPVAADPGLLWKLLRRILNTHVVRRGPLFEKGAATPSHDCVRRDTVHLNAILDALLRESFRKSCDRSIGCGNSSEGRRGIESGTSGHENHGAFSLLESTPCPNR